jgi:hypothetical protein
LRKGNNTALSQAPLSSRRPVHVEDRYVIVERSGSRWEEGESRKT